ncbi:hypothetical protein OXX79_014062, partial [Metschnikowia pulcherrima]
MKNTLVPKLPLSESTKYGVAYAIAQFNNQFEAAHMAIDLASVLKGKISPQTTHAVAPGGCKERNENAAEGNKNLVSSLGVGGYTNNGNNELRKTHTSSTGQQHFSSAENLNTQNTRDRRANIDNVGGQGGGESVKPNTVEESRAKVE